MTQAAAGDWLATQVERYEGAVLRYAVRILGDLDLARDVAQDTFMRLCERTNEPGGANTVDQAANAEARWDLDAAPSAPHRKGLTAAAPETGRRDPLLAWLLTVCRNRAIDVARRRARLTLVGGAAIGNGNPRTGMGAAMTATDTLDRPAATPGPGEVLERSDESRRTLELLAALPANQQEVVRLRFQCGLSYAEIANVTGLSKTNVGFLLHTALKRMRNEMSES